MTPSHIVRALLAAAASAYFSSVALAQTSMADRVLVVENASDAESRAVADYYVAKRAIPAANICKIHPSSPDILELAEYDARVKAPVRACLEAVGKDKILYIVFSYKTPFSLSALPRNYALDQFVADIWDEFLPARGATENDVQPYFGQAQSEGNVYQPYVPLETYRKSAGAKRLYSVWRLDAATADLAKGLVDKALFAETYGLKGQACFDRRYGDLKGVMDFSYGAGDWDVHEAAEFAGKSGFAVVEDSNAAEFGTAPAPLRCESAALYAGWYSMEHYNDAFTWVPGAIGIHLDSESATHLRHGSSWVPNAVMKGITVTSGAIDEPYLENIPHPDQMLLYLLQGANVGDALLRSTRLVKWRIMNVGDPLYRPFPDGVRAPKTPGPELFLALVPPMTTVEASSGAVGGITGPNSPGGLRLEVSSDYPNVVKVPASVIIPSGDNHASIAITSVDMGSAEPLPVKIRISAGNMVRSNTLVVFPMLAAVVSSQPKLKGGSQGEVTVTIRRPAPAGGLKIALTTDAPAVLQMPAELVIAQGQNQAKFTVSAKPVTAETKAAVHATYGGGTQTATLTVLP